MSGDGTGPEDRDDLPEAAPPSPYALGNTREDGSYKVGKNRTPAHSRFAAGDGRPRGRRGKGQRNFDTEFQDEARRLMSVSENGKKRRVSKLRGTIICTFDRATSKADSRAMTLVFSHAARIADGHVSSSPGLSNDDAEELNAWLSDRLASLAASEEEVTSANMDRAPEDRSDEQ